MLTLTDASWTGAWVQPLQGPKDYSFDEAAAIIGESLGRPVKHVRVTPQQAVEAMATLGFSPHVAILMTELMAAIDSGLLKEEMPRTAATTTPTTFEEFVKTVMAPAWQSPAVKSS